MSAVDYIAALKAKGLPKTGALHETMSSEI